MLKEDRQQEKKMICNDIAALPAIFKVCFINVQFSEFVYFSFAFKWFEFDVAVVASGGWREEQKCKLSEWMAATQGNIENMLTCISSAHAAWHILH